MPVRFLSNGVVEVDTLSEAIAWETRKSKDMVAQYNEVLCKCLAYNITVIIHEMFELGIQPEFTLTTSESIH